MRSSIHQKYTSYRTQVACGIDEAGRGAWAGPLVAASVVIKPDDYILLSHHEEMIKDSKTISTTTRKFVFSLIKKHHISMQTKIMHIRQINNRGIQFANITAIRSLVWNSFTDINIVDGKYKLGRFPKTKRVISIIDADATILPVILAGIVAKVTRDDIMDKLHIQYPQYDWVHNKGYGTVAHRDALAIHGITKYHRGIFVTTALNKHR